MEVDVVVVGSGAGGLTAAVVSAQAGLSVLLCEKTDAFGGTTALSLGGAWIVANPHQKEIGIDDSKENGEVYLRNLLGERYDKELVGAFLVGGTEMVEYMEKHSAVQWIGIRMTDYYPGRPGATFGRSMLIKNYDGRMLGKYLTQLRMPLRGFALFGSLQIAILEVGLFHSAFRKMSSFLFVARRMLSFGRDLLLHQRGTHLANGGALIGRLLHSALDAGVELRRNAPVTQLVLEDGAVRGVMVQSGDRREGIRARRGVVLATGGFGANAHLSALHMPMPDIHVSAQPEGNNGDGIRMGQEVGGALADGNRDNGIWVPISILRHPDGRVDKFPHFGPDRGKPGAIVVDGNGERFADEAAPYQDFVRAMLDRKVRIAYFIGSRAFQRKYGMGLALPAPYPVGELVRKGYLVQAATIDDLGRKLDLPIHALREAIFIYDRDAVNGTDPAFHKGESIYDHTQGDPEHPVNPNVGPLGSGPYFAVRLYPGNASTTLGFRTNARAQVLSNEGGVVQGLFAVGLDQNSVMRGEYPGGGVSIGPAMTFGYLAARTLAEMS